ncbi:MAG: hypothetical protein KatS3mg102_2745 [Planctomycetota bacterium]|nr:MAG: hypothetical protein KatS3mg102_2745 [Planctomycetota bacterium]
MAVWLARWWPLVAVLGLVACSGGGGGAGGGAAGSAGAGGTSSPAPLRAGAAVVDITPGTGAPLAGYGGDPRRLLDARTIPLNLLAIAGVCFDPDPSDAAVLFQPARGVHDPITARALVLERGGRRLALIKLDTVGVSGKLRRDLEAIAAGLGIAPADLMVTATHTHSGPGAVADERLWQIVAVDCFHEATYRGMLQGCERALLQAVAALAPAELGAGVAQEHRASRNRSGRPGVVDPELGLIKVVARQGGAPIAAVLNFAVHGTALGPDNLLFSADVMGYAERELEARLGGGVALFVNGAEGDVAPAAGGYSGAQAVGTLLAETAAALWPAIATSTSPELRTAYELVPMPAPSYNVGCLPIPGAGTDACNFLPGVVLPLLPEWLPRQLPFQAWRLGEVAIATVPGEPITEIGLAIKQQGAALGFAHTFVAGLANDHMGYVTTLAEYVRADYEGRSTLYGPQTGQLVIDAAARQLAGVR